MLRRLALFAVTGLTVLFGSTPSVAGDKSPLSSLRTLPIAKDRSEPETYGVPGLTFKETTGGTRSFLEITAATSQGYCIADREFANSLQSSRIWTDFDQTNAMELLRLVTQDDHATLESSQVRVVPSKKSAWVVNKTSVELRPVARSSGVTVWAYRDRSGDVVLLARGGASARELRPNNENGIGFLSSDCAFGTVRLFAASAKSGTIAQLRGSLPPLGEGKEKITPQFVVNANLAKLSRDPEPLLDVRIRMVD